MSTRSLIIMEKMKEGKKVYEGTYCHWDGYPSNNGAILFNWYKNRARVEKLISLGQMSSLGKFISPEEAGGGSHSFDNQMADVTVYYGRDRGEENTEPFVAESEEKLDEIVEDSWAEYVYIYGLDNVWRAYAPGYKERKAPLGMVLIKLVDDVDILYPEAED